MAMVVQRITLDITYDDQRLKDPAEWFWPGVLSLTEPDTAALVGYGAPSDDVDEVIAHRITLDVTESFELAMEAAGLDPDTRARIQITVDDALTNNWDEIMAHFTKEI